MRPSGVKQLIASKISIFRAEVIHNKIVILGNFNQIMSLHSTVKLKVKSMTLMLVWSGLSGQHFKTMILSRNIHHRSPHPLCLLVMLITKIVLSATAFVMSPAKLELLSRY